ncbi:MAG TPA: divergent polysaccharide deacetylase family protein [Thermoanaerobaculia bacterium]
MVRRRPPRAVRPGGAPGPRRLRPFAGSPLSGLLLFLLGVLAGAGGFYVGCRNPSPSPPVAATGETDGGSERPAGGRGARRNAGDQTAARSGERSGRPPHGHSGDATPPSLAGTAAPHPASSEKTADLPPGRVALVIDDLGRSLGDLDTLARLGVPLSYAVLPFEEETPQVVAALHARGEEVLCHLPMQAKHGENPGPGALRLGMSREQLTESTRAALAAVPGAVGVNNHMGSGLSADATAMGTILSVLAARGLFFLDSRTSAQSVGYRVASSLGLPAAERQVFLDDDLAPDAIHTQFQRLLELSKSRGEAIAIGHPHAATLAALLTDIPKAKADGFTFVRVSALLDRPPVKTAK